MKKATLLLLLSILLLCCNKHPKEFGAYISSKSKLTKLSEQQVNFSGNLINSKAGFTNLSNIIVNDVDFFYIYLPDIQINNIKLSQLTYLKKIGVRNFTSIDEMDFNKWYAFKDIDVNIEPIKNTTSLYKLIPDNKLSFGTFCLHFGILNSSSLFSVPNKNSFTFSIQNTNQSINSRKYALEQNSNGNVEFIIRVNSKDYLKDVFLSDEKINICFKETDNYWNGSFQEYSSLFLKTFNELFPGDNLITHLNLEKVDKNFIFKTSKELINYLYDRMVSLKYEALINIQNELELNTYNYFIVDEIDSGLEFAVYVMGDEDNLKLIIKEGENNRYWFYENEQQISALRKIIVNQKFCHLMAEQTSVVNP